MQAAVSSPVAYHPDFEGEDDVVLVTSDSVRFRISSAVLRHASGFFHTMFDNPQPDNEIPSKEPNVRSLDEDARTMAILLKVASGLRVEFLKTFGDIVVGEMERIAFAADKYDMSAALDVIELAMYTPTAMAHPLHRNAMATRYGWHDVSAEAALDALDLELTFQDIQSMDMAHFNRLLRLRHRRVAAFATALNNRDGQLAGGNRGTCYKCQLELERPTVWENMKRYLLFELASKPSGSSISFDDSCCVAASSVSRWVSSLRLEAHEEASGGCDCFASQRSRLMTLVPDR
ncbi:hypothetical protein EXIGLDRAFT_828616 [Exidia glandulosa HHB12029]|uniref:BTB domain-containing protein n=1 Tax=Exidia glandulosa HHB12029 TaxID=1314781 RepID=A0A165Q8S5_EXIGL|nr:hypothetical protein EXIGLDRAFT_828616 [Exidia glandulosa HHB12029]